MKDFTQEVLAVLSAQKFTILHDPVRDLYLAYSKDLLFNTTLNNFQSTIPVNRTQYANKPIEQILFPQGLPSEKISITDMRNQLQKLLAANPCAIGPIAQEISDSIDCMEAFNVRFMIGYSISLSELKNLFSGPTTATIDGANCTNGEALQRIQRLEKILTDLLRPNKLATLFDYLPYTKSGKFARKKPINLYIPDIRFSNRYDYYFTQNEISLQLTPVEYGCIDSKHGLDSINLDNIAILRITDHASFTNRTKPANIIMDDGSFLKPTITRNCYLSYKDLIPGTSYTDVKNSEYLYLGRMFIEESSIQHENMPVFQPEHAEITSPLFIRVTSRLKTKLKTYNSLSDFLEDRFTNTLTDSLLTGINQTESKKFLSTNTVYFTPPNNIVSNLTFSKEFPSYDQPFHIDYRMNSFTKDPKE